MPAPQNKSSCRKRRADASKPCSVPIPQEMQEALIRIAERDDRSFSATIRQALVAYLKTPA